MSHYQNPDVDGVHMHLENKKVGKYFFWFLWIMYVAVYMTKYCFSSAMAPIVESGILTKSQTGFIGAAFHMVYAPLQIVGGMFADRYNPERMIKIGLFGSAITNLVIFFNQNYYVMLGMWVLNAIFQFALWPSVFKIMASQLPRSEKPKYIFIMSLSTASGLLLSYIVAGLLPYWQLNFAVSSIVSFVLLVSMIVICNKVDRFMLPDREVLLENIKVQDNRGYSMTKLALQSGLALMVLVAFIRSMIGQGSKTMAPTMLMESYENISASIGNLLNVIIILSGIAGTLVTKFILYPRIIKNEIAGALILFVITIPLCVVLCLVGTVPSWIIIAAMSGISFCTTSMVLFVSYYNASFAVFGKDGTVAGLSNCAASAALIVQTYGFSAIADGYGWMTVNRIWVILSILATLLMVMALPIYIKFKNKHKNLYEKNKKEEGK